MRCRLGCGACCIAPSIHSPMPGMPDGKASGERCLHLSEDNLCQLFGSPLRPDFCAAFRAQEAFCGSTREQALQILTLLEEQTASS